MVVRDIMTKSPVHVAPNASVFAALNLLNDLDVRHLPVVVNGELRGIISDRDLRSLSAPELERAAQAESQFDLNKKLKQCVADLMNPTVFFVGPESLLTEAIDIMLDQKIGAIPVVDSDNTLVGIVSYVDILREAAKVL
jgi:CBS domain-containing protein